MLRIHQRIHQHTSIVAADQLSLSFSRCRMQLLQQSSVTAQCSSRYNRVGQHCSSSSSRSLRLFSTLPPLPSHIVVPMPALSPTMETGSISKWNLGPGDKFDVGTVICEVETDKASVSYEATDSGYLAKILVQAGEIKVGQPIMITVEEQEDVAAFADYQTTTTTTAATAASVSASAAPVPAPAALSTSPSAVSSSHSTPISPIPNSTVAAVAAAAGSRLFSSPLARKLAKESGTSIARIAAGLASSGLSGSGPQGRIVAADVLRAASIPLPKTVASTDQQAAAAAAVVVVPPETAVVMSSAVRPLHSPATLPPIAPPAGVYSDFVLSASAVALAARQTAAKQSVPHYYLSIELDLSNVMKLRADLNSKLSSSSSTSSGKGKDRPTAEISVLDFLVKASALAMKQVPDVNGAWMETFVRRYEQVDINLVLGAGSAVAAPVLRDVSQRGLSSISSEIGKLEDALFSSSSSSDNGTGLLSNEQLAFGTFSIHNLGIYGVKSAAPIVMTPQACALSLGSIVETVVPAIHPDRDWDVAPLMVATLSCDHRVVDGAVGAQWLAAFKALIENPTTMLL